MSKLRAWRPQSRRARILLRILVGLAVVGVLLCAIAITTTSFESYSGSGARPDWAEPCRNDEPRHDRKLLADCARSTGYVAWVREEKISSGREVHFALVGRFGVIIVKLGDPEQIANPPISSHVTVVGALVRARNGMREIQAWRLKH